MIPLNPHSVDSLTKNLSVYLQAPGFLADNSKIELITGKIFVSLQAIAASQQPESQLHLLAAMQKMCRCIQAEHFLSEPTSNLLKTLNKVINFILIQQRPTSKYHKLTQIEDVRNAILLKLPSATPAEIATALETIRALYSSSQQATLQALALFIDAKSPRFCDLKLKARERSYICQHVSINLIGEDFSKFTEVALRIFTSQFKSIKSFVLENNKRIKDISFLSSFTSLRDLGIYGCEHLESFDWIEKMPRLSGALMLGANALAFNEKALKFICSDAALQQKSQLHELTLFSYSINSLPFDRYVNLRVLRLFSCQFNNAQIFQNLTACTNLTQLNLLASSIDENVCAAIGQVTTLKELTFDTPLTATACNHLTTLQRLEFLEITKFLSYIWITPFTKLKKLSVIDAIVEAALLNQVAKQSNLQSLILNGASIDSQQAFNLLELKHKSMFTLCLDDCEFEADADYQQLLHENGVTITERDHIDYSSEDEFE